MKKTAEKNHCYRFQGKDRKWAAIVACDETAARIMFQKEYRISDKRFEDLEVRTRQLPMSARLKSPYSNDTVSVALILNTVLFTPRLICDDEDY